MGLEHISASLGDLEYIQRRCTELANGAKAAPIETSAQSYAKFQKTLQNRKVDLANRDSEVGKRFENVRFADFTVTPQNSDAYTAAVAVVTSNFTAGLSISGPPGVGKSMLAAAIVNEARASGTAGVCISALNLLLKFREKFDLDGSPSELSLVRKLANVPVLAIQDLGKEPFTAYTLQMLHAIMDARWENSLPLIVTANLDERAMMAHYSMMPKGGETMDRFTGPTMIDRVMDMTGAPWQHIAGVSHRGVA